MTRSRSRRLAVPIVLAGLAVPLGSTAIAAPAHAAVTDTVSTAGWTWEIGDGEQLLYSATPSYLDIAGTPLDATGWGGGTAVLPRLFNLTDSIAFSYSTPTVAQAGEEVTVTSTASDGQNSATVTVEIVGGWSRWEFQIAASNDLLFLEMDASASGYSASGVAEAPTPVRWYFTGSDQSELPAALLFGDGSEEWVVFVQDGGDDARYLMTPDRPASPGTPAGTWTVTAQVVDLPNCTEPASEAAMSALAGSLGGTAPAGLPTLSPGCLSVALPDLHRGEPVDVFVDLAVDPQALAEGLLDDPSSLRLSITGLPAGVSAVLDASLTSPRIHLVGTPTAVGNGTATMVLYRDDEGAEDPLLATAGFRVTAVLPATGPGPDAIAGATLASVLLLIGGAALAAATRRPARRT